MTHKRLSLSRDFFLFFLPLPRCFLFFSFLFSFPDRFRPSTSRCGPFLCFLFVFFFPPLFFLLWLRIA